MTKFPNPFELLEKKKNLEDMQNINDAKNIGNTTIDYFAGGGDLKGFGDVLKGSIFKEVDKHKKPVLKQLKKDLNKM